MRQFFHIVFLFIQRKGRFINAYDVGVYLFSFVGYSVLVMDEKWNWMR